MKLKTNISALFFSIVLLLIGCSTDNSQKTAAREFTEKYTNQKLKRIYHGNVIDGDTILHGSDNSYYENGQLKSIGKYVNGNAEGEFKWYHENGQLEEIKKYVNGKEEGEFKWYHKNGQLEGIEKYVNGKAEGEFK
ncbi:MAG: toxin-antitoxin system YwqK family antitoxin, partial [Bacteroidia bacterium]